MEGEAASSKAALYVIRGCLVVPIQVELDDELMLQLQKDILERVNKTELKGVIIDVSGVAVIDSSLGQAIFDTARMASLMGAQTIVTGLTPGVAASLTDLDFDPGDVPTATSLEEGFRILVPAATHEVKPEEVEEGLEDRGDEAAGDRKVEPGEYDDQADQ